MYTEECSCSAAIKCRRYYQLVHWRNDHFHEMPTLVEPLQMPPQGAVAETQIHPGEFGFYEGHVIGFRPNVDSVFGWV